LGAEVSVETWRLLDLEYEDSYMNLAVEEAIPRMVGKRSSPNTVRFWRNHNTIVIGRFQCKAKEIDANACMQHHTSVVRRFTGGGAVYQDYGNLNFAVSVAEGHPQLPKDLLEIYQILGKGVIRGLTILGLNASFKSPNVVQLGGRKISGIAGSLSWGVAFLHGTLLVNSNLQTLLAVLSRPSGIPNPAVSSAWTTVTSLRDELGKEISITDVKDALKKGFEEVYEIDLAQGSLTSDEMRLAHELCENKYSKELWNSER
jgi:lipoate-protein ligase A